MGRTLDGWSSIQGVCHDGKIGLLASEGRLIGVEYVLLENEALRKRKKKYRREKKWKKVRRKKGITLEMALLATDADSTDIGTSFGEFVDTTGVIEIGGLFSWTGASLDGSVLEIAVNTGLAGVLMEVPALVVQVFAAMMIFWLCKVFMISWQ